MTNVEFAEVRPTDARFGRVVRLASSVLNQDRYLVAEPGSESQLIAAFAEETCVGFLRFVVQDIGQDVGRPPVIHDGSPLREGYVEAFGVDPSWRRRGIGGELQRHAATFCRQAGCYQMRSRSPITSAENYALKINAGYTLHPSRENDSYYFILGL